MTDIKTWWVISALGEKTYFRFFARIVWNKEEVSSVLLWEELVHPVNSSVLGWILFHLWVQTRLLVAKAATKVLQVGYFDRVWIHHSVYKSSCLWYFCLQGGVTVGQLSPGLLQEFGRQCLCLCDTAFCQSQGKGTSENAERRGREHPAFPGEFQTVLHN